MIERWGNRNSFQYKVEFLIDQYILSVRVKPFFLIIIRIINVSAVLNVLRYLSTMQSMWIIPLASQNIAAMIFLTHKLTLVSSASIDQNSVPWCMITERRMKHFLLRFERIQRLRLLSTNSTPHPPIRSKCSLLQLSHALLLINRLI